MLHFMKYVINMSLPAKYKSYLMEGISVQTAVAIFRYFMYISYAQHTVKVPVIVILLAV